MEETWRETDRFICGLLVPSDPALEEALRSSAAAGLPDIQVAPNQGMLLHLLAMAIGARRILEVGTLGGYSAICFGRALPQGGHMVTIEADPHHARVARQNIASAGLADVVEVREGLAADVLAQIGAEATGAYDLVFIDADKRNAPLYFAWALRLTHPGSLIVVDNVVRRGALVDAASEDPDVQGMQTLMRDLGSEARVKATAIQTVGLKGYDGFAIALVRHDVDGKAG